MQQQIQINQPAQQFLAEAAAYFARRRAKVTERTEGGFRFGFEGSEAQEGGRVTVAPSAGAGTTVTVEAEGLGVMAIAEGFIRELRKQARDAGRQGRGNGGTNVGSGFSDLRQRLGMPEAPPAAPPRPSGAPMPRPDRPSSPLAPIALSGQPAGGQAPDSSTMPPMATDSENSGTAPPTAAGERGAGVPEQSGTDAAGQGAEAAARPTAVGADDVPDTAPQAADPAGSAVSAAAAVSEMHHDSATMPSKEEGAPMSDPAGAGAAPLPHRGMATSAGDSAATTGQEPGHASLTTSPPSAEQLGGVPAASDVHVGPDRAIAPGRQSPGPAAGEASGEVAPPER